MIKGLPGEEGAGKHHKESVDNTVEWLGDEGVEVGRGEDPVGQPTDRNAASLDVLPAADDADPPRPPKPTIQHL